MKPAELREEIAVELEALEATVNELVVLQEDVALLADHRRRVGPLNQSPPSISHSDGVPDDEDN